MSEWEEEQIALLDALRSRMVVGVTHCRACISYWGWPDSGFCTTNGEWIHGSSMCADWELRESAPWPDAETLEQDTASRETLQRRETRRAKRKVVRKRKRKRNAE